MANKYHQMAAKCKRQDPKYQVLGSFSRDRSIKSKKRGEFALGEFYHLRQHAPRSINCLQVILPVFQVREDQTPVTSLDGGIFCAMSQAFRSASSQNFCFAFNGGQYLHNEGGGAEINTTLSSIKLLFVSNFFFFLLKCILHAVLSKRKKSLTTWVFLLTLPLKGVTSNQCPI